MCWEMRKKVQLVSYYILYTDWVDCFFKRRKSYVPQHSHQQQQQPTSLCMYLCGFALFVWLFSSTLIRSGPTNNRLALDKRSKKKNSKLFTIRCSQLIPKIFIAMFRMELFFCALKLLLCISISFNFHFSTFCSIWLINLYYCDVVGLSDF